jgi:hypothetical protein
MARPRGPGLLAGEAAGDGARLVRGRAGGSLRALQPKPAAAAVFADHASAQGALALGRALALAAEPPPAVVAIEKRGGEAVRREAAAHRREIQALVPRLRAAQRSGDRAAYGRLSAEAVKHGDAMTAAYREAAADRPAMLRLLERAMGEFMGHGHVGGHGGHGS